VRAIVLYIALLLLLLAALPAGGASYYVDYSAGNDGAAGTELAPWKTLHYAATQVSAGDTIYLRAGKHMLPKQLTGFPTDASSGSPVIVSSYSGEVATLSTLWTTATWTQYAGSDKWWADAEPQTVAGYGGLPLVTQDGVPLKLATAYASGGTSASLTAAGQWCRDNTGGGGSTPRFFVWCTGNNNPNSVTMGVCEFPHGGNHTIELGHGGSEQHYVHFQNLIVEGGYYCVNCETDGNQFTSCTFRCAYGEAFKVSGDTSWPTVWQSTTGTVSQCDIYYFGGVGIDITGGDDWTVTQTDVHDGLVIQGGSSLSGTGIMMKNDTRRATVERCRVYNLSNGPAFFIGGSSFGGRTTEAKTCVVKNCLVYDVQAQDAASYPYLVGFFAAHDCQFLNNTIYDCTANSSIIRFGNNGASDACANTTIQNNIISSTTAGNSRAIETNANGMADTFTSSYNMWHSSPTSYYIDGVTSGWADVLSAGYEANSTSATAPAFADAANADFSGSSQTDNQVGVGVDLSGTVDDDFNGDSRPAGVGYDVGAYEWQSFGGSGSLTAQTVNQRAVDYIEWTCETNASGVYNEASTETITGQILGVLVIPDSGGTQPTDLFDITLSTCITGSDTAVSNTGETWVDVGMPDVTAGTPTVLIENAGASKLVTVRIYYI